MKKIHSFYVIFFLLFFSGVVFSFAASVSLPIKLDTMSKEISVDVLLDAGNEKLNAYSGQIRYDNDYLFLKRIETNDSIVTSWVTFPEKNNSLQGDNDIYFEGITSGGFSGVISAGNTKKQNGKILSLVFSVQKDGGTSLSVRGVHVYKDDGMATEIPISDKNVTLSLPESFIKNTFLFDIEKVNTVENGAKNDVYMEISSSTELYNGKDFLIFDNKNKQKSVTNFEVSESPSSNPRNTPYFSWTEAKSPYYLTQSGLTKYVHVKANYSDGTFSYATLKTVEKDREEDSLSYILMVSTLLSLTILYVIFFAKKKE